MLSLKFKRMCSRVIASLSAMGFISIADSSGAEIADFSSTTIYQPGEGFRYNLKSNLNFVGKYSDATSNCRIVSKYGNITGSEVVAGGGCNFKCKSGTFFQSGTSYVTGFFVSGDAGATVGNGDYECVYPRPTCSSLANASSTVSGTEASGYTCNWACNDGYFVSGEAQTTTILYGTGIATAPAQSMSTTKKCVGKTYVVTLDCQEGGTVIANGGSSLNQQMVSTTGRYGASFTFGFGCTRDDGSIFVGWQYASGT